MQNGKSSIREMKDEDLEKVAEIWLKGIKDTAPPLISGKPWDSKLPDFKEETRNANEKFVYYDRKDRIIKGFITAGIPANKNYILGLYVDSESQGKGIGTKLLDKLRKTYRHLTGHVYEQNHKAIKFYIDHGFEVSGKKKCPDTGKRKLRMTL